MEERPWRHATGEGTDPGHTPVPVPDASEAQRLQDHLIGNLYDLALEPRALDHLPAALDRMRRLTVQQGSVGQWQTFLAAHLRRVIVLMQHDRVAPPVRAEQTVLSGCGRRVAFTVESALNLTAVNPAAAAMLGLHRGQTLSALPLEATSRKRLEDHVRALLPAPVSTARIGGGDGGAKGRPAALRLRLAEDGQLMIAQLSPHGGHDGPPFVLITTSLVHCPDEMGPMLREIFGLSVVECEILRRLCKGHDLRQIAEARGRSIETIRAQLKSALAKTETRSQTELMRLLLALDPPPAVPGPEGSSADWVFAAEAPPPHASPAGSSPVAPSASMVRFSHGNGLLPMRPYRRARRRGAGRREFLELGAPEGRPVLWCPGTDGICRLPPRHEAAATRAGLRLIVPVLGGYGLSAPPPEGHGPQGPDVPSDVASDVADVLALMDQLKIERAPLLTLGSQLALGCALAAEAGDGGTGYGGTGRISALVGVSPPPLRLTDEALEQMGPWHRLSHGTARDLPEALPALTELLAALAAHLGPMGFHRKLYAGSDADQATAGSLDFQAARAAAQEILLDATGRPLPRVAADLAAAAQRDLRPALAPLEGRLPVHLLFGRDSLHSGPRTHRDYARSFPWLHLHSFEGAGELLHLQKVPAILELLAGLVPEPTHHRNRKSCKSDRA